MDAKVEWMEVGGAWLVFWIPAVMKGSVSLRSLQEFTGAGLL